MSALVIAPPSVEAWIIDALTDGDRGGNPAAVVLDADGLDAAARLAIAARIGLSETAFVSRSTEATIRLEFFTPTRQIAHCGHATVATFALLRSLGRIGDGRHSKETIDGLRTVLVDGAKVLMAQRAPRIELVPRGAALAAELCASLGLAERDVYVVDTGNLFALFEVGDSADLQALRPDFAAIAALSERLGLVGYYVFSRRGAGPGRAATARMFAPRYGIDEEAATGMAAGPLACLLHELYGLGPTLLIEQGAWMATPSPSAIEVRLELRGEAITGLFAGGRSRIGRRMAL